MSFATRGAAVNGLPPSARRRRRPVYQDEASDTAGVLRNPAGMPLEFASLVDDAGWVPMNLDQQNSPTYLWADGGLLADAPVDFAATFAQNMWTFTLPIHLPWFNRNPLRVVPNFMVPRHEHNIDETIVVFKGEYVIEYGEGEDLRSVRVGPGNFFTSRAGTPYTMTAGPEGVTYIETWGVPVTRLKTVWYDHGWVHR